MLNQGVKSQFGSWNKDKFVITTLWPFFPKVNLELISFQDFSGIFFPSDKTKKHTQDKKQMLKFTGHLSMYIIYLHVTVNAEVWPRSKHIQWNGHCGPYSASSTAGLDLGWDPFPDMLDVLYRSCLWVLRKDFQKSARTIELTWGLLHGYGA